MKTRLLAVVVCLVTVAAFGQSNPKLKEIQWFAGSWQCTGTAFASPMGPEHPTRSTVNASWVLGGAWLQLNYTEAKTAKNPHPFALRALWSYDEEPKAFVSGTVDNMGGYSTQQSPGWEGDKFVFTGPMHSGGMTVKSRDTFTRLGKNKVRHEGEMEDKGNWIKLDTETCTR
ncbi:MAG: DUF1579 family protein [Acidobacteria bacterium]|nr:DUF1579 family protein [Acidobacteriota bacterium]MBV9070379.1 DUF1579 family protein [Acidobacteriota bacterium]MBV9184746.1 DUF1579 family protein [Acidobacteriota bacterium]